MRENFPAFWKSVWMATTCFLRERPFLWLYASTSQPGKLPSTESDLTQCHLILAAVLLKVQIEVFPGSTWKLNSTCTQMLYYWAKPLPPLILLLLTCYWPHRPYTFTDTCKYLFEIFLCCFSYVQIRIPEAVQYLLYRLPVPILSAHISATPNLRFLRVRVKWALLALLELS